GGGWVGVAVLIAGFAAALVALGSLSSSDFIALVSPLAALLTVVAVARGRAESPDYHAARKGTDKLSVHAARAAEPLLPGSPPPGEARVHNQPVLYPVNSGCPAPPPRSPPQSGPAAACGQARTAATRVLSSPL